MATMEFATIASSSSGNCVYVGTEHTKILIDAGLSGKKIEKGLDELSLNGNDITAIFVTHEHIDHVDGVGVLSRRYDLPVYATEGTWANMPKKVGEIAHKNKFCVYREEKCVINDICINPFAIPHDAAEPVGYSVFTDKSKIAIATDIGHVTKGILDNLRDCNLILLESNHDIKMLERGAYPFNLKKRILGKNGHLSNEIAGKLLACIMTDKLSHAFLGHLSSENNTPSLAFSTVKTILEEYGIEVGTYLNLLLAPKYGVESLVKI